MDQTAFIEHVVRECMAEGVTVVFAGAEYVKAGTSRVSGYFDDDGRRLAVASRRDDWLAILAHEFGHFIQYREHLFDSELYTEAYTYYDEWLEGRIDVPDELITRYTRAMQEVEQDAEVRAVEYIKKYNLPVDLDSYIQRANVYVLFYEVARRHRKWSNKTRPYDVQEIIDLVPSTFVPSLHKLPDGFEELVVRECFK